MTGDVTAHVPSKKRQSAFTRLSTTTARSVRVAGDVVSGEHEHERYSGVRKRVIKAAGSMTTRSKAAETAATTGEGGSTGVVEEQTQVAAMFAQLLQKMTEQSTTLQQQLTDQAATARQELAEHSATQQQQLDRKLEEQSARLSAELKKGTEEAVQRLEERLTGQLQAESAKFHESLRREVGAVNDRVDSLQQGQDLNRGRLDNQQTRLESVCRDQRSLQDEVREKISSLSQRLDATQREMYNRMSSVAGSAGSVDDVGVPVQSMSLGSGGSRLRVRPMAYDGKIPFSAFLIQYEQICAMNCFDDAEKASFLVASLTGPALNALSHLQPSEQSSYSSLVAALNSRFDDGRASEMAKVRLDACKQGKSDSISTFACALEDLFRVAYPQATAEARDMMLKDRFLSSIYSAELRKQTRLLRPTTFNSAVSCALEVEALLLADGEQNVESAHRTKFVRGVAVDSREAVSAESDRSDDVNAQRGKRREQNGRYTRFDRKRRHSGSDSSGSDGHVTTGSSAQRSRRASGTPTCWEDAFKSLSDKLEALSSGQGDKSNRRRGDSQTRGKRRTCFICGSESHFMRNCPSRRSETATDNGGDLN